MHFFLYAVVSFPVFVCENPKPNPGFDLVQTLNAGLEKDVRVWNRYRAEHLEQYRVKVRVKVRIRVRLRNWPNVQRIWPKAQCDWSNVQFNQMCLTLIRRNLRWRSNWVR